MNKNNVLRGRALKIALFAVLIILLHITVIIASIQIYKHFTTHDDMKITQEYIKSGVIDEENLEGMIFEYQLTYDLSDGSKKEFDGKETYYYDGKKLVPISEFMK